MTIIDIKSKAIKTLRKALTPLDVENRADFSFSPSVIKEDSLILFGTTFETLTIPDIRIDDIESIAKNNTIGLRLILTEDVSSEMTEAFQKFKISFCDTVGNFQICLESIRIVNINQGFEQVKSTASINLNSLAAMKLIFCLLRYRDAIQWPMRRMAEAADVSLGSVQRVIEALKKNSLIFVTPKGRFFKNKRKLLDIWVEGFNSILLPKITLGRAVFRDSNERDSWWNLDLTDGLMWGGEPAAQMIDGYLKAEDLSIFTSLDFRTTVKSLNLIPTGSSGYITIFNKFWRDDDVASSEEPSDTVPLLIVYAQLMGSFDSRCKDAAKRLLNSLEDEELSK